MNCEQKLEALKRIISRSTIDLETGCWICGGWNSGNGYAKISIKGISWMVHRFSFEIFHRHLRNNEQVDHICCNRACWNPAHLQGVTNLKNQRLRAKRNKSK